MLQELPEIPFGVRPQILLVGNGINLVDKDSGKNTVDSWENIIKATLKSSGAACEYAEIDGMPSTMQIVVATRGRVKAQMKTMAAEMALREQMEAPPLRKALLDELLSLPCTDVLTCNYGLELERHLGLQGGCRSYSASLRKSRECPESKNRFRNYTYWERAGKRVWHVHGDIAKHNSMVMGHYYYSKMIREMGDHLSTAVGRWKRSQREGHAYKPTSWMDYFLIGDVYILGLSMYLCESDLWYLIASKQMHFEGTRLYFYDREHADRHKELLLGAYGVHIPKDVPKGEDYFEYDMNALRDIRAKMASANG